jgi:hypothetical protein
MFISRTVIGHTELGKYQTVTPENSKELDPNTVLTDYYCHVIVQPNKLAISTGESVRAAHHCVSHRSLSDEQGLPSSRGL